MTEPGERQATLADVLDELKAARRKDWWEPLAPILTVVTSLLLGFAGLWFTKSYNDRQAQIAERQGKQDEESKRYQNRVLEMQAVEKFVPYLSTRDEQQKETALLIITTLASPEFATQFAKLHPSRGAAAAADRIMATATPATQTESPAVVVSASASGAKLSGTTGAPATKSGWVYLGHYVAQENRWQSRYFDFAESVEPAKLVSTIQTVWTRTGDINVRTGMPTLLGQFQRVREVLKAKSQVKVKSVKEWNSTGYMWAEVDYET